MPLSKRWAPYAKGQVTIPNQIGVYELAYNKQCIYIGSGNIADRIASHDADGKPITNIRYEITNSRTRALQRERAELHAFGQSKREIPKYNSEIPDPPR